MIITKISASRIPFHMSLSIHTSLLSHSPYIPISLSQSKEGVMERREGCQIPRTLYTPFLGLYWILEGSFFFNSVFASKEAEREGRWEGLTCGKRPPPFSLIYWIYQPWGFFFFITSKSLWCWLLGVNVKVKGELMMSNPGVWFKSGISSSHLIHRIAPRHDRKSK